MKRLLVATVLLASVSVRLVEAEGPDAQYVQIYNLIGEADQLGNAGQPDLARDKYIQAHNELEKLQASYPNWNEKVVRFRLEYLSEKLKGISPTKAPPASREKIVPPQVVQPGLDDRDRRIHALTEEVRQLRQDKSVLEAKLREALTAQPAAIDPRELAKAEERVKMLEKEKELLRVSLEQEQAKLSKQGESANIQDLKRALADATRKLNEQTEKALQLARDNEILEARLQSIRKEAELTKNLQVENQELKRRLGEARPVSEMSLKSAQPSKDSASPLDDKRGGETEVARLQIALKTLQEEKANLETTKRALEAQLSAMTSAGASPKSSEGERLKLVEKERDDLLRKLNETSRLLYDNKARTETARKEQYDSELAILRARLEVFEARTIPYTPEEKALFKEPGLTTAKVDARAGKKSIREPKGTGPLVEEAERAFRARRFDEAEKRYLEILRVDDRNVFTLANLAACLLEQNRLNEAENHLKRAMESEPDDPHSLSLLGILKFRQLKLDEALDALSRAAQLDPQNPETQNYLGITLSQKGQRGPAETALRKAVQLAPSYGGAHHNLAVVYATQQPPFIELARWHYQKALASGHSPNPELEKLIEGTRSASAPK
ncbi:MAG: tetratricopeptide repeat protein [Verrucomicrobia bacterium]|nr:tetratricopeptide repeat protein [Verrucomicrobiota bacterium]